MNWRKTAWWSEEVTAVKGMPEYKNERPEIIEACIIYMKNGKKVMSSRSITPRKSRRMR